MNFLKCKVCGGEIEVLNNARDIFKKIKCLDCGYTNKNNDVEIIRQELGEKD